MTPSLLLILVLAQANAGARPPASRTADPASHAAALSRAWSAVAQGEYARAEQLAATLLRANPADHAAVNVAVTAAAARGHAAAGLDTYETWLRASRHEDPFLLQPIAIGVLTEIGSGGDTGLAVTALGKLVKTAPEAARAALGKHADSETAFDPIRAALGDRQAVQRVVDTLAAPSSHQRLIAIHDASTVRDVPGAIPTAAVSPLLADPAPPVRAGAIELLAHLGGAGAMDEIRPLLSDGDPFVRATAAVALGRLGDPTVLGIVQQMADSPTGDTAAMAAAVLKERGADVTAIAARIAADENPLTRLSAASLVAADSELGRSILSTAAADTNPVIRSRAAEVLSEATRSDLATLRRLLRDANPEVRLAAAASLIRLIEG